MSIPTRVAQMFGIQHPIFAFSHTREVVAAVSRAGGLGVYGASVFSPERVDIDLAWIANNARGRPFGVDVMLPLRSAGRGMSGDVHAVEAALEQSIPQAHKQFVEGLLKRFAVPPLTDAAPPPPDSRPGGRSWRSSWNEFRLGAVEHGGLLQAEIALKHPISLLVSALGPPPTDLLKAARERNIKLGALVGSAAHARKQVAAGIDIIIAQGSEAAAHTGEISTMVLVPEVVDAVHPVPVLAAGGIGSGRQLAAAYALGAEGAWTGSIWLAARESDEPPEIIERLLAATSSDTVRSKCRTGKPLRQLQSPWSDAWEESDSPGTLPMPTQHLLTADAEERIQRHHRSDLTTIPVGQIVGRMHQVRPAADVLRDLVDECGDIIRLLSR